MRWAQLERAQPRLAAVGRKRPIDPGVLLVVTIARTERPG
jgi:hypothetical protein